MCSPSTCSQAVLPVVVTRAQDVGTHVMLTATLAGGASLKARLSAEAAVPQPGSTAWLQVLGEHTCFYRNEELVA